MPRTARIQVLLTVLVVCYDPSLWALLKAIVKILGGALKVIVKEGA